MSDRIGARLEWTEAHALGNPEIDEQHQQLFQLYNEALVALQANPGHLTPGAVLRALIDYTGYHFATEEAVMAAAGYPRRAEHGREHQALLSVASNLVARVDGDPRMLADVVGLLRVWIQGHVLCSDRELGVFLKGRWRPSLPRGGEGPGLTPAPSAGSVRPRCAAGRTVR